MGLFDCRTVKERAEFVKRPCRVKGQTYWPSELYFGGIVMSNADAHPTNGDTAVTVFIGGQVTILNGAYPMRAGDQVRLPNLCFGKE